MNNVKLFMGMIIGKDASLEKVQKMMTEKFSGIDFQSEIIEFNHTDYYYNEMGRPLKRKFISFKKLIEPGGLAYIKNTTCEIERKFSQDGKRTINIDPGYISLSKVVLASTKNFYHRIYIGHDIYAEVTLCWQKGEYRTFEWTFPDYKTLKYKNILKAIRDIYESNYNT